MKTAKDGFVIILVVAVLAVLILVVWVLVDIGCGEILQVKSRNDLSSAKYAAIAGAERVYARLKYLWASNQTVTWPLAIGSSNLQVYGNTVGTYSATAYLTSSSNEFCIVSNGTVNGRTVTMTVKYGYTANYTNGVPIGSLGSMTFTGHKGFIKKYMVTADGPVESASGITPNGNSDPLYSPNNRYVQYTGTVTPNKTDIVPPSFWLYQRFDTTGAAAQAGITINHANPDYITREEAQAQDAVTPGALTVFDTNNKYQGTTQDADRIDDKDAFYYYYTGYLTQPANNQTGTDLGIEPGGANYITPSGGSTGTVTYGPFNVPAGKKIIFVDGNVNIIFNAQKYWGNSSDLTLVSMGDITIVQPANGSDDRLTLVACGDVATGGINLGDAADIDGNLNIYSSGDFDAVLGGVTNGSIFATGNINVDTEYDIFGIPIYSSRDLNMGTDSWTDPAARPLGIPPNYSVISTSFKIKAEGLGTDLALNYKPRWQKR